MTRISLRAVPFDNPRAQALLAAFYADQLTRYERADPPHEPASDYAPPHGLFLLLGVGDQPAGCGGYRARDAATGEIKRLYVCPQHRGRGYGRRLLAELETTPARWAPTRWSWRQEYTIPRRWPCSSPLATLRSRGMCPAVIPASTELSESPCRFPSDEPAWCRRPRARAGTPAHEQLPVRGGPVRPRTDG